LAPYFPGWFSRSPTGLVPGHVAPGGSTDRKYLLGANSDNDDAPPPPPSPTPFARWLSAPYRSGPARDWIKVKNRDSPAMRRAQAGDPISISASGRRYLRGRAGLPHLSSELIRLLEPFL
jgi:hypothetical protein